MQRKPKKYSFVKPDPTLKNNLMAFGFECGDGWYGIIFDAFDKIQKHLNKIRNWKLRKEFRVVQVKEKFGGLRIYCNYETEYISDVIDEAVEIAYQTCELCGTTNNVDMRLVNGWYSTLCEKCAKSKEEEIKKELEEWRMKSNEMFK